MLKLQSGYPNVDQLKPELAQMVPMVERNLGLTNKALHPHKALGIEVSGSVAQLPSGFFEEDQILDFCIPPNLCNMTSCSCNNDPCRCGYTLWQTQCGDFTFGDTILRCPFKTGSVSFSYWSLELDEEGLPMILDSHVEAFVAYAIQLMKKGEMNAGLISPALYQINKQDWHDQSLWTRSRDNVPSKKSVRIADYITNNAYKFYLK